MVAFDVAAPRPRPGHGLPSVHRAPVLAAARATATPPLGERRPSQARADRLGPVLARAVAQRARHDAPPASGSAGNAAASAGSAVQRSVDEAPTSVSLTPASEQMIQRDFLWLGEESWWIDDVGWRTMHVYTGTAADWFPVLKDIDDWDDYVYHIQGFLEACNRPNIVGQKKPPPHIGDAYYYNDIRRRPNKQEKIEFIHALFERGEALDLWEGGSFEAGDDFIGPEFAKFIRDNQDLYLEAMAKSNRIVSADLLGAVATEAGYDTTLAMIVSAGASAYKGLVMMATAEGDDVQKTIGGNLIQNAGITLRGVLAAHTARVAFKNSVVSGVFDHVWGTLPGGGYLVTATKDVFKPLLSSGLNSLAGTPRDAAPKTKFDKIYKSFQEAAGELANPTKVDKKGKKLPKLLNSYEVLAIKGLFAGETK